MTSKRTELEKPSTTPDSLLLHAGRTSADDTAQKAQRLQAVQDGKDKAAGTVAHKAHSKAEPQSKAAAPGPGHPEPVPPLPSQHLKKPGLEADMNLAPRFQAPAYHGCGKLEGLTAIITGADSGIGRAVAVLFAREGADVAVMYLNEHEDALETQR